MTTPPSVNLHSMPMNFDAWAKIVAGMTPAQEGTLLRAVRVAWQAGHRGAPAATLPNHDGELGRMLGGREHLDVVRRVFKPVETAPELLAWPWLNEQWAQAVERYQKRKLAGVESGETRRRMARERTKKPNPPQPEPARREQCSNNVPVMLEQPEPNPVGVGSLRNQPPTGAAVAASSLTVEAPPPDKRALALAWVQRHPEVLAQLNRDADAYMDAAHRPDWRARDASKLVREGWLLRELERVYGSTASIGEIAELTLALRQPEEDPHAPG